jgi:tetratricopeptide (TPR) repeat protein
MFTRSCKGILLGLLLVALAGCATISYLAGIDSFFGQPEPVTQQARAYAQHLAGVIYERQGNFERAIAAWQMVIELDKEALAPRLRLVGTYARQGDNEKAMATCWEALQHFPEKSELWIIYGELNHRLGNIEPAIAAFNKAINLKPDDLTGYGALVELQESTNDLVAAIDIYERLIEKSPNSAALYYQLGINLAQINDNEYAQRTFQKVLELEPRITRARFFLALTLFQTGNYEQCAEELRGYLLERPFDTAALEYRAAALMRLGRMDEARYSMELILAGKEAARKNSLQHSWVLLESNQVEQAQQFSLEAGAYLFADIIFATNLLRAVALEDRPATPWDDRFTLDEVETESDLFISSVMNLFGKEVVGPKVLAMLDSLQETVGFSPALSLFRSRILLEMEAYEAAVATLEVILENGIASKHVHYHCAIAYEELKNTEKTEEHLRSYLEIDPEDPDVLNFLGYFYADLNINLEQAEDLLNRALKKDPDNPFYLDSMGWLYFRRGDAEKAAAYIHRAIYNMESDDALLREHLGDVYLLLGNTERALSEWRRALRLDPSLDSVREKTEKYTEDNSGSTTKGEN